MERVAIVNKVGFIGTGNLAVSLIKGLRQKKAPYSLYLYDLMKEKADALAVQHDAQSCSFAEVIAESEIIVLAVKPKDIQTLLQELSKYSLKGKLIITVAAGVSLDVYEKALPRSAIVRVMPNTSSAVLQAVSGLVRGQYVSLEQALAAEQIFSAVGKIMWIEDKKINALTAVSGSGPAYFYLFTELMAIAGEKLGLNKEEAEFLARETLVGAGKMLSEDKRSPQELREAVTSPNGTTFAALQTFSQQGLDHIVYLAMKACLERAGEMEREGGK